MNQKYFITVLLIILFLLITGGLVFYFFDENIGKSEIPIDLPAEAIPLAKELKKAIERGDAKEFCGQKFEFSKKAEAFFFLLTNVEDRQLVATRDKFSQIYFIDLIDQNSTLCPSEAFVSSEGANDSSLCSNFDFFKSLKKYIQSGDRSVCEQFEEINEDDGDRICEIFDDVVVNKKITLTAENESRFCFFDQDRHATPIEYYIGDEKKNCSSDVGHALNSVLAAESGDDVFCLKINNETHPANRLFCKYVVNKNNLILEKKAFIESFCNRF